MIYHIYWGTSGNSGLYLHEIYKTLEDAGYSQKAFVNFYFPFDYGEKIFFKRGDIAYGTAKGKKRKVFQLLEVLKGYLVILCCTLKDRPVVINYSHVGQSHFFVPAYLRILKAISGAKLIITCHDVAPHSRGKTEMKYRKQIFHLADYLLVHTDDSARELVDMFGADKNRIVKHLFPIMDLSLFESKSENTYSKCDFLFIGHLRQDKGIDFLMETWKKFHAICPNAKLRVCGKKQPNVTFDETDFKDCNVEFNLHFISDADYFKYVMAARYVILPYQQGTNSGIISTVLSLGTDVITSDIPMFAENPLVSEDDVFKCMDVESLTNILVKKYNIKENNSQDKLGKYREDFCEGVLSVYNSVLAN